MLVKNEVYDEMIKDGFKIVENDNNAVTMEDILGILYNHTIETKDVDYFVSTVSKGNVVLAHNKKEKTITPIMCTNLKQHKTYDNKISGKKGDKQEQYRMMHNGNVLRVSMEFIWFLNIELMEKE